MKLAIVGPGRVGSALGRRWREAGLELLGFVGRRDESTARAVAFAGGDARALQWPDLAEAGIVVLAVGDAELAGALEEGARRGAVKSGSLWVHCGGRHGLEVLDPVARLGALRGCLHPVQPFPDAESGYRTLPGRPAVLLGDASARGLLTRLAELAGLRSHWSRPGERALYHAACALAANGLTALRSLVDATFAEHGGLAGEDADAVAGALMAAALEACERQGPAAALSGPVVRGDAETLAAHVQALSGSPRALAAYRALMLEAVELAFTRGAIDQTAAQRLRTALS